jgi:hypothetical protein
LIYVFLFMTRYGQVMFRRDSSDRDTKFVIAECNINGSALDWTFGARY